MAKLTQAQRNLVFRSVVAGLSLVVIIYLLLSLKALILPIIIGALLAYLVKPLLNSFKYRWLPESLRITFLLFFFTSILFSGTYLIRESLPNEKEKLELLVRMQFKFNEKVNFLFQVDKPKEERGLLGNVVGTEMAPFFEDINKYLTLTEKQSKQFEVYYENGLIPQKYFDYYKQNVEEKKSVAREISSIAHDDHAKANEKFKISLFFSAFSIWIVMPLVFLFLLFDKGEIFHYALSFVPNRYFELTRAVFEEVDTAIGKYLRGTLLECMCVGLTMFIGFYLIGLNAKASLLIGLIGGLTNAIPFLGTAVALVLGLSYGIIAEDVIPIIPFVSPDDILIGIVIVVFGAHLLDNAYFQPVIVGSAVNIHPLVVVLSVFGGSLLFGFAGILLAIPTIVILKTTFETLYKGLKEYYII